MPNNRKPEDYPKKKADPKPEKPKEKQQDAKTEEKQTEGDKDTK